MLKTKEDIVGYTKEQLMTLLRCTEKELKAIIEAAGFDLVKVESRWEKILPVEAAREILSVYIPPEEINLNGDFPGRFFVKYFEQKRRREMKGLEVKRTKRTVTFRTSSWEVEAKKEILKPSNWAIVFNGEFVRHVEAQTGEGAILKCFEVPAYVRAVIRKKVTKK